MLIIKWRASSLSHHSILVLKKKKKKFPFVLNLEVDLFDTAGRSVVVAKISGFVAGS